MPNSKTEVCKLKELKDSLQRLYCKLLGIDVKIDNCRGEKCSILVDSKPIDQK